MGKKRAILCIGAESTGTRVMCRRFNAAGYHGKESGNYFDQHLPIDKDKLVWHRTYPLDGMRTKFRRWVKISTMVNPLRKAGFDVRAVVNTRDWHSVIKSQIRVGHTTSHKESWERLQKSYAMMFQGLKECSVPFVVVTYESIILHGKTALDHMFEMLDIEPPTMTEEIKNGNEKYY